MPAPCLPRLGARPPPWRSRRGGPAVWAHRAFAHEERPAWPRATGDRRPPPSSTSRGRCSTEYGFGNYLIYAGIAPFIDGRVEHVRRRLSCVVPATGRRLPALLAEYRIGWTLPCGRRNPQVALLDPPGQDLAAASTPTRLRSCHGRIDAPPFDKHPPPARPRSGR